MCHVPLAAATNIDECLAFAYTSKFATTGMSRRAQDVETGVVQGCAPADQSQITLSDTVVHGHNQCMVKRLDSTDADGAVTVDSPRCVGQTTTVGAVGTSSFNGAMGRPLFLQLYIAMCPLYVTHDKLQ